MSKVGATLLGGNMEGEAEQTLVKEFERVASLRPQLSRHVYHCALSLRPEEHLDEVSWRQLIRDYLEGMGFHNCQYVAVQHRDRDHDHVHIVANRVRPNGSVVSESWDYKRSEALLRHLEKCYQLTSVPSSYEVDRQQPTRRQREKEQETGQVTVKQQLQQAIDNVLQSIQTVKELIAHLSLKGIQTWLNYDRLDQVRGISFAWNGVALAGTHLGCGYTLPALGRKLSLSLETKAPQLRHQIQTLSQEIAQSSDCFDSYVQTMQAAGTAVYLKQICRYTRQPTVAGLVFAIDNISFSDRELSPICTLKGIRPILEKQPQETLFSPPIPGDFPVNSYKELYSLLTKAIRGKQENGVESAEVLDVQVARLILEHGSKEDVRALVYSPEFERLKQQSQDRGKQYLRRILSQAREQMLNQKQRDLDRR